MPLILEPASAFYSSPLVVLDFQSLYPSIMIAYNYCYSTCLGRVRGFKGAYKLGVNDNFDIPPELLQKLHDNITGDWGHIVFLPLNLQENNCSCGEWHHVCETQGTKRLVGEDVGRAIGYQSDGKTSNEECGWRQSKFSWNLHCEQGNWYLRLLGPKENLGCSSTGPEIHRQCYIWLHCRDLLRKNACSWDCW